jgi:hypothetical protein
LASKDSSSLLSDLVIVSLIGHGMFWMEEPVPVNVPSGLIWISNV